MIETTFKLSALVASLGLAFAMPVAADSRSNVTPETDATAEVPLNDWVLTRAIGEFDGFDAGSAADTNYTRLRVEARFDDGTAVFFNCVSILDDSNESIFDAAINLDTSQDKFTRNIRWQYVSGQLTVGERQKNYRWKWNPATMIMAPLKKEAARRLFNGVVKGESVAVRVFGETYIGQSLPAPNPDFTEFYKSCPALSGS